MEHSRKGVERASSIETMTVENSVSPVDEGLIDLKVAVNFPLAFWQICLIMAFMYATVIPFNTIHSAFLQTKWYVGDPVTGIVFLLFIIVLLKQVLLF
jgi:hypothetical protein